MSINAWHLWPPAFHCSWIVSGTAHFPLGLRSQMRRNLLFFAPSVKPSTSSSPDSSFSNKGQLFSPNRLWALDQIGFLLLGCQTLVLGCSKNCLFPGWDSSPGMQSGLTPRRFPVHQAGYSTSALSGVTFFPTLQLLQVFQQHKTAKYDDMITFVTYSRSVYMRTTHIIPVPVDSDERTTNQRSICILTMVFPNTEKAMDSNGNTLRLRHGTEQNTTSTWWFKMTFLGWLSDPFKGLSDLQLGDQQVTLNPLVQVLWNQLSPKQTDSTGVFFVFFWWPSLKRPQLTPWKYAKKNLFRKRRPSSSNPLFSSSFQRPRSRTLP